MDFISKEQLRDLISHQEKHSISLYMPTYRAGAEIQQNPIRFKNLLRQAEDKLSSNGLSAPEVNQIIEHGQELLIDPFFWQYQSDGLAVFLSPSFQAFHRLPLEFEELVVISDSFHIKPLLPLFTNDGRFFILALSQGSVRLLEGSRFSVDELEVESLPKSMKEALPWDDAERQLQFHTQTLSRVGGARRSAVYHGHGAGTNDEVEKENIRRFFHKVNDSLSEVLADQNVPLVLAGVEYLLPIYQEVNSYNHLVKEGIKGNPEGFSMKELHAKAWEILEPHFREEQEEAAALFTQQAGMETGRASTDLPEIVQAAATGRVGQLFVPLGVETWGSFDPNSLEVTIDEDSTLENTDLLDFAATQTILNGGVVYAVEPEEIPAAEAPAAVFRY